MFTANRIHRLWIIWAAVFTVCTSIPMPCPQDSCYLPDVKEHQCKDLEAYIKCMKLLSKKCRGDIGYHSSITVSNTELKRRCIGHEDLSRNNTGEQSMIPFIPNHTACPLLFDDKKEHRFCGLFGDPHLRTFDDKYQTCRIRGAWQVIENSFFGIMVTNDVVSNSTTATAPTKLTVILKAHKPECTQQKLYVAQGDAFLPNSFEDGTTSSGPASSPTVSLSWNPKDLNSETVYIRLSYISTIISVTRVGKYLSLSAKLPEQLAQAFNQDNNDLCSTGCPAPERINIEQVVVSELDHALNVCHNSIGPTGHRLTDQYLDWCVFDMLTSHDDQFINASHAAYSDVLFFEPRSLFNRTVSIFELSPNSTASASCVQGLSLFILIIIGLYNSFSVPIIVV